MEPAEGLLLDSPMKIRREYEWIYFKLKRKVDASETLELGEVKELVRLLTVIKSLKDDNDELTWCSERFKDWSDARLVEALEARLGALDPAERIFDGPNAGAPTSSASDLNESGGT